MAEDRKVKNLSIDFAVCIVDLVRRLQKSDSEFVLSNQICKSGTSIGANIREAEYAASKADFINKLQIALKEANETIYWLDLLVRTDYLSQEEGTQLRNKCFDILHLLVASIKTAKRSLEANE